MSLSLYGKYNPRQPRGGSSEYLDRGCQASGRAAQWSRPPVNNHAPEPGPGPGIGGHPSHDGGSELAAIAARYWQEQGQDEPTASVRVITA